MLPAIVTAWVGMHFGFAGDVVGNMTQPVEFPSACAFDFAPAVV